MTRGIGLALGSGAARGYAHLPVIQHLEKKGVRVGHVAGSSIGALVGAYYCLHGEVDSLEKLARGLRPIEAQSLLDMNNPSRSLIKGEKIVSWMRKNLYGDATFKDLKIPLTVVASDIDSNEVVFFEDGDLVKAVRASISIPGIFQPYEYAGRTLIDGGVKNPVPVDVLFEKGYRRVVGVSLNTFIKASKPEDRTVITVLMGTFYMMMNSLACQLDDPRVFAMYPKFEFSVGRALDFSEFAGHYNAGVRAVRESGPKLDAWLKDAEKDLDL